MIRSAGRVRAGMVTAILAAVLTGCGVSTQDEPEPIDPTALRPVPTPTITVVPDTTPAVPIAPGPADRSRVPSAPR